MLKKHLLSLLVLLFLQNSSKGQIYLNPGVDTSETAVKKAIQFYQNYLAEFKGGKLPDFSKYWSAADCKKYKYPDQLIYGISGEYPTYSMGYQPTILYIKPENDYVHIKTHFGWVDSLKNISTLCITNHFIKAPQDGQPYFINPIDINSKNWQRKVIRNITYYYPSYHSFNQKKSDSLIHSIKKLEEEWAPEPIKIRYYFAATSEEIQRLRGFDYSIGMGNRSKPSGIADDRDNLVYCSGWGENYFHEVVHVYLNRKFSDSPIKEGLAAFYGGSMGRELNWHLKRLNSYLQDHPEINLNNLEEFWKMDNYTNPQSVIQGMLCKLAFEKDGINGLKRIMTYKSLNVIFEKEYGLTPDRLNEGLRKIIAEQ